MSSILDDLASPPQKSSSFAHWLETQPAEVLAALTKAATDPRWSDYALEQTLRKHSAPCSKESVRKWRNELGLIR